MVEREKLVEICKDGLEIVGVKEDRDETFVWWRKRQLSDLFRIDHTLLNAEAQKRLDELVAEHVFARSPI